MQVRMFDHSDYKEVSGWWLKQNWPAIPLSLLTNSGFIAEDNGKKIAATWIFETNCPIYIMEWTVGNPDVSWDKRSEGISLITLAGCDWAKSKGAAQLFTMTKVDRYIEKLENIGFQKTDSDMTHLMRIL